MHARGLGTPLDWVQANALYLKACQLEDGEACNRLGVSAELGRGQAADQAAANARYEEACRLASGAGCNSLAISQLHGKGVPRDPRQAAVLQERACDLGHGEACAGLGHQVDNGIGVARDQARAIRLYRRAVELGSGLGHNNLGYAYESGQGVQQDWRRANELYEQGCRLGNGRACSNLGNNLVRGAGLPVNKARAVALYEKSCALDTPEGCFELGLHHEPGGAARADARRARTLQLKGCALGYVPSCYQAASLLEAATEAELAPITRACAAGGGGACFLAAVAHFRGRGLAMDPARATALGLEACGLGDPRGCGLLGFTAGAGEPRAAEAVAALTAFVAAHPSRLVEVQEGGVRRLLSSAARLPGAGARLQLLEALFEAGWAPEDDDGAHWASLALARCAQGRLDRATDVVARISSPYAVAGVRVDARCKALLGQAPAIMDVEAAKARNLARLQAALAKEPRSLRRVADLADALVDAGRPQEALDLAVRALAWPAGAAGADEDEGGQRAWLHNVRSGALESLGRHAEAGEALRLAAAPGPDGSPDVGIAINHAFLRCRLGEPRAALLALEGVGRLSPYGHMQLEAVRLAAAHALGDAAAVASSRDYLQAHRADSMRTWQRALLILGEQEEAARAYLARLEDPAERAEALLYAQALDEAPETPTTARWAAARLALLARPEVVAALARAGRVERIHLKRQP